MPCQTAMKWECGELHYDANGRCVERTLGDHQRMAACERVDIQEGEAYVRRKRIGTPQENWSPTISRSRRAWKTGSLLRASVIAELNVGWRLRTLDDLAEQAVGESNGWELEPKYGHARFLYLAQEVIEMDGMARLMPSPSLSRFNFPPSASAQHFYFRSILHEDRNREYSLVTADHRAFWTINAKWTTTFMTTRTQLLAAIALTATHFEPTCSSWTPLSDQVLYVQRGPGRLRADGSRRQQERTRRHHLRLWMVTRYLPEILSPPSVWGLGGWVKKILGKLSRWFPNSRPTKRALTVRSRPHWVQDIATLTAHGSTGYIASTLIIVLRVISSPFIEWGGYRECDPSKWCATERSLADL